MKASPGHIGRREFVRMKLCSVVVWLLAVLTCGTIAAQTTTRDQVHWVPMRDQDGAEHRLFTRICRPTGDAPAPVVLINHGSPPDADARPAMRPASCESEAVQWFLARGYLVVLGMRRGYGETGGPWAEDFGPGCGAEGYARAGLESARDLDALVTYATTLPFARPDGVVVVGQSAGGWATVAYDSRPHPKVVAMVSMAGGRGGHQQKLANHNCRPDELARAAGLYGATASTPMLWVFTANDSFFAPQIATQVRLSAQAARPTSCSSARSAPMATACSSVAAARRSGDRSSRSISLHAPAAADDHRSLNSTPPFALLSRELSTISTSTASAVTPKFFTTASVMSLISARF
jgi:pimeloyl-ACP methyl ester carboxylesterase